MVRWSRWAVVPRSRATVVATIHDGTYLGRRHAVYDPPLRILGHIAGVTLREMAWNRELTYACGEPGGVFHSLLPELSRNTARRASEEAARTGAEVLITACPATLTLLQKANHTKLKVRDLVEIAADAVVGPAAAAPY